MQIFGLVELTGADFTTYLLDGSSNQWKHFFSKTIPYGSPLIT